MFTSFFHCDGYRLAAEIAENNHLDRLETIDKVCEYFDIGEGNVAIPVYFQELLKEYYTNPIVKYIYDVLVTYVDEPIGKIYVDF